MICNKTFFQYFLNKGNNHIKLFREELFLIEGTLNAIPDRQFRFA